jgi:serine/threonine-protein kinase RsbW
VTPESGSSRIELTIPAAVEWLALARTTGAAVATRLAFNYDEITDLRLAIDELCLTLVEGAPATRLEIFFEVVDDVLTVEGRATGVGPGAPVVSQDGSSGADIVLSGDLSARILDALVDEHGTEDSGESRRAWLRKQRSTEHA